MKSKLYLVKSKLYLAESKLGAIVCIRLLRLLYTYDSCLFLSQLIVVANESGTIKSLSCLHPASFIRIS